MGARETKNYGLIKAIHVGTTAPLNTKILWYDDNVGQKIHKYYDVVGASWVPFGGGSGTVNGIYTYIAFATSCEGADFNLVSQPESTHFAIITSATEILVPALIPALFDGKWVAYCATNEGSGNFTYVGYADDCEGANYDTVPTYVVPCKDCEWADGFVEQSKLGTWTITPGVDGFTLDFSGLTYGDYITIDLTKSAVALDDLSSQFIEIQQASTFVGAGGYDDEFLEILTDTSSLDNYQYQNDPAGSSELTKVMNGSIIKFQVPIENVNAFSGSLFVKIGNVECALDVPPTTCYGCRKYIGIVISETPIDPVDASTFEDVWIPFGGTGCGCESPSNPKDTSIENLNQKINNLRVANQTASDAAIAANEVTDDALEAYKTANDAAVAAVQADVDANEAVTTAANAAQQLEIDDLIVLGDDHEARLLVIEGQFDSAGIMAIIDAAVDAKLAAYKTATLDPITDTLDGRITVNEAELLDHEARITALEPV